MIQHRGHGAYALVHGRCLKHVLLQKARHLRLQANGLEGNESVERTVNARVRDLCARFPIYQG